ncbi:multiple epidermal growth factor-like domains protein 11 isoform X2 [Magallana gigas]|uniref:multiple epidermal growth factor-like domains protein 11 isoform X2 n=1 Tax=Magallana gigas TaxID=29159 RepID=UPI00333F2B4B
MHLLWLHLFFHLFILIIAYENIALRKPAWQRFPYSGRPCWGADRAVDGRYSDLSQYDNQCTISGNYHQVAEWRVDLQKVLSMHHIVIYYRTDNEPWGNPSKYSGRFLGFSVYISKTTNKEDGITCFKDRNFTRATIENPITINCPNHGRYAIYYNNRTQPPFPSGYSTDGAYNEICEFEVYGCPTPGYYGENCSLSCPQNCQEGHCHIEDGTCLRCTDGYKGPTCNEQCNGKSYGQECQQNCGNCKNNEQCHHVNGSCIKGCASGFYGTKCDLTCPEGRYGYYCEEHCNINCGVPYRCDRVTGQCEGGCQVGWEGATCDTQCNEGKFGQNCNHTCGHCLDNEQCNYINGTCPNGCDIGYQGTNCTQVCSNNTHGDGCLLKCGNCLYLYGEQCHHVTGQCPRGCDIGYHGDRCDQVFKGLIHPVSESQLSTSLSVCTTFLILSGLLNAIFVVRFLRERRKTMRKHKKNLKSESERNKELEHSMPIPECSHDQYENFSLYEELGISK